MDRDEKLRSALKNLLKPGFSTIRASVLEIDEEEKSVDVLPADGGAEIFNVRLRAALDESDTGVLIIPKVGSEVLISCIDNNWNCAFVSATSEIDKVQIKIEGVVFTIDQAGFGLKKENETLKKLVTDLIDTILALIFQTNQGVTIGLVPVSVEALNNLKVRVANLLTNGT